MRDDIKTREDIDALMRVFYSRALEDDTIGYVFTDVARIDLDAHLPIIGDFWESLLLGKNVYQRHGRNPLQIHGELSLKTPLDARHFRRWLEIFTAAVDEMFAGESAEVIKQRAEAIANRMVNFIRHVPDVHSMNQETSEVPPILPE